MSRPQTLLEGLCGHALSLGAEALEIEYEDRHECVYARQGNAGISIARYASGSRDAKELRGNLYAAHEKPVRTVLNNRVWTLKVRIRQSFGEDAFEVAIEPVPALDAAVRPAFTKKQGQYLAYIRAYTKIHRRAPAELDLQTHFRVSAPSVHQMIQTLERNRLIERVSGEARSIRLLVSPEFLPVLE